MILPFLEPVISALPLSAVLFFAILFSIRMLVSEGTAKLSRWNKYQMNVFRREAGKTFLESVVALYVAWHIGAATVNRVGVLFTLMDDNIFLSADLWVFVAGVLSVIVLTFHGSVLALECVFRPAKGFVSDFSSGTAWRPLTDAVYTVVDYVRGVTRILRHALRCMLKLEH